MESVHQPLVPTAADAADRTFDPPVTASHPLRPPFVVSEAVAAAARQSPEAPALFAACGTLSYAALDARAERLAGWLRTQGVGPDSLVGICLERSFDQLTTALATWKAGGAFLPLDPAWPDERLRTIADDAGCVLILGRDDCADRLTGVASPVHALDWDRQAISGCEALDLGAPVTTESLAYVIYTSGTTGTPKGVEITHGNLSHLIAWHLDAFAVTASDRATHLAGLGFDASLWEVWPYLCAGASVTLIEDAARTSPDRLKAALLARDITIAFVPTALAQALIAADWPADTRLRFVLTGADRLTARPRPGLPFAFVNNYGPTECTVVATSAVIAPDADQGLPPIGAPIGQTFVRILDAAGCPVASGETGELFIGGPTVGRGYRRRPDLTAERFVIDPFGAGRLYRTGDLAAQRADGQLEFHGRVDDQVKIRGHRVEPEEVASLLGRHDLVTAASVIARRDAEGADALIAYVVPNGALTAEDLRDFLAARLPEYMIPATFVRIDTLPLTANGKIDKAALPAPDQSNAFAGAGFAAPSTPAELRLAEILEDVLGRGGVGVDDNFFLLGGHSLLGTQVVLRAGEAFGIELALRDLFLAPTIRQLAAHIEAVLLRMIEQMSDQEVEQRAAE
ncbi:non-ribosomal peptide synthetase [Sphingosinicella sp. BN140058]|uniref:non-ribosomal peptide synthetase n=1 Tax=Sphingosinicella sp. BN140058 TaxID=1892855 RepID=UPI0013EDF3BC|nr:non-ribosomal peptide synthetase [Sphingosinicella sp. BN140058]